MMHCSQLDYNKVTKIPFPYEHSGEGLKEKVSLIGHEI